MTCWQIERDRAFTEANELYVSRLSISLGFALN